MVDFDIHNNEAIENRLRQQAESERLRVTVHAHQEMVEENISLDEVKQVLFNATLIENYTEHKRGSCCLVCGKTLQRKYVHVVITTSLEVAIIITVYEPKPPKWVTPFERGK